MLRRVSAFAILTLLPLVPVCAQNAPPVSTVDVSVKVPGAPNSAGIKLWLSGGSGVPGLNESAVTDTDGQATLHTRRSSMQYVVARRADCDITLGGSRQNLTLGGDNIQFRRGRLDLTQLGTSAKPDFFFSLPTLPSADYSPAGPLEMRKKTPGKARFAFIAEDSEILRRTFAADHEPQPVGKVFVTGSWNNFSLATEDVDPEHGAKELIDDGSFQEPNGDDQIGDGVFSRVLDLPPGEHTYVFLVNGIHTGGETFVLDPYAEATKTITVTRKWQFCPEGPSYEGPKRIKASVISVTASEAGKSPR